jgi:hypothetical protein
VYDPAIAAALALTGSDKKFMAEIVQGVQGVGRARCPCPPPRSRPRGPGGAASLRPDEADHEFFGLADLAESVGSNPWLRERFQTYFVRLLATISAVDMAVQRAKQREAAAAAAGGDAPQPSLGGGGPLVGDAAERSPPAPARPTDDASPAASSSASAAEVVSSPSLAPVAPAPTPVESDDLTPDVHLADFNYRWLARWRGTDSYKQWHARLLAGELTFDFRALAGHPTHVDDLQAQLARAAAKGLSNVANGIDSLSKVDLAPLQENITKAIGTAAVSARRRASLRRWPPRRLTRTRAAPSAA